MSVAAASLLALTFSCSRTETDPEPLDGPVPIRFKVASADADVKGTGVMTTEKLNDFGLFAVHVPVGSDRTDLSHGYMMNVQYTKDATKGWYDTNPPRYWPVAGNLTFFALAPYDDHILETVDISAMMAQDYPTLEWGPSVNPAEQVDVCVAVNSNQPRQLEVPLEFHHATSQIYFAANFLELSEGEYIVIDTIILHNIIGRKHVTLVKDIPYVEWEPDGKLPRDCDYLLYNKPGDTGSTLDSLDLLPQMDYPEGVKLTNDKGTLYLVPQTYSAISRNVEITVKYTLWLYDPDTYGEVRQRLRHTIMEGVLPSCTWEPDTRYRYILTLNDKTRELGVNMIHDYYSQPAKFFAMTCTIEPSVASAPIGAENVELTAVVGPDKLIDERKEVDWEVEAAASEYIEVTANGATYASGSNVATVKCKKVGGPFRITVTVRRADTGEEPLKAYCDFTVTPSGLSFSEYPSVTHDWD